ncbi:MULTISPECIES: Fur-regulated basic protein FbpA [unclassified Peribacillus]|uniref:Fur-regulated basic protein FbpA n=1 Tax=unclassified Peribacillus TaxID=2675266 RepID=UPI0028690FD4|nr:MULTISPECIES: Fur-regulated basic protein FbpA [unclassified Peribacillus]WMX57509.1 Fur-regulated basic protein FbpA [Peribacillus sp. R9-11]
MIIGQYFNSNGFTSFPIIARKKVSTNQLNKSIVLQRDFYKSELLIMDYFKTPEGRQLYELSLPELESIFDTEKAKVRKIHD